MIPVGYGNFERNINFQLFLNSGWAILLSKFPMMVAMLGKLQNCEGGMFNLCLWNIRVGYVWVCFRYVESWSCA